MAHLKPPPHLLKQVEITDEMLAGDPYLAQSVGFGPVYFIKDEFVARLREHFYACPRTGLLMNLVTRTTKSGKPRAHGQAGEPAGRRLCNRSAKNKHLPITYYRAVVVDGHEWLAHHLSHIMRRGYTGPMVDHHDGDGEHNHPRNLRITNQLWNSRNNYRTRAGLPRRRRAANELQNAA